MKKNQIISSVTIEKIGYEGIGIARFDDGKKLIIKGGALPGMVCDLRVVKNYKDYAECHIVEIHSFSSEYDLSTIKCPHYLYAQNDLPACKTGCGGCKRQIASYDQQLILKKQIVQDSFRFLSDQIVVLDPFPSPEIRGYRNKIEYSFGKFITGRGDEKQTLSDRSLGFHRQGMFGKIVDIDQCFLVDTKVNQLFQYCKKLITSFNIPVYDQVQHEGVWRHLMIRQAKNNQKMMIILSVGGTFDSLGERTSILDALSSDKRLRSHVDTFVVITNDSLADVVATRDSKSDILRGSGVIDEYLVVDTHTLTFSLSPQSFFQTNTHGAELLYETAIKMTKSALGDDFKGTILDLYCGTGTIGLSFLVSGCGDRLIGIEETPSAVEDARANAVANHIMKPYHFFAGKVEKILTIDNSLLRVLGDDGGLTPSSLGLIIVDPPRSGLHKDIVELLLKIKEFCPHIVVCYISCNPVTLARDCKLLMQAYTLTQIQPVDMFPHTHHIENIVLLR